MLHLPSVIIQNTDQSKSLCLYALISEPCEQSAVTVIFHDMLFNRAVSSTLSCSLILWLFRMLLELLFTVLGQERGGKSFTTQGQRMTSTWYLIQSVTLPDLIMSAWALLLEPVVLLVSWSWRPDPLPHSLSQSATSRPASAQSTPVNTILHSRAQIDHRLLRQLSYTIKTQLEATKAFYAFQNVFIYGKSKRMPLNRKKPLQAHFRHQEVWVSLAVSLRPMRAGVSNMSSI